uniref:(northern house mosquito) hypothetical protein n=1 Tax=Culex pipiens TaxID=7175 RepID=A0A8D8P1W6_CULPI
MRERRSSGFGDGASLTSFTRACMMNSGRPKNFRSVSTTCGTNCGSNRRLLTLSRARPRKHLLNLVKFSTSLKPHASEVVWNASRSLDEQLIVKGLVLKRGL